MLKYVGLGWLAIGLLTLSCVTAKADPNVIAPVPVVPGNGGLDALGGAGGGLSNPGGVNFAPGNAGIFMCPGIGGSASVLGFGGGYCDFNFQPIKLDADHWAVMHNHCEWGSAAPVLGIWNCWRVFPGQPDHPALQDPDIIPDGMGVPWAIAGPVPSDQWPPPGLATPQDLANLPPPVPHDGTGAIPGPPEIPDFKLGVPATGG